MGFGPQLRRIIVTIPYFLITLHIIAPYRHHVNNDAYFHYSIQEWPELGRYSTYILNNLRKVGLLKMTPISKDSFVGIW